MEIGGGGGGKREGDRGRERVRVIREIQRGTHTHSSGAV